MKVDRVIVHFLRKEEKKTGAVLDCSEGPLPLDDRSKELVTRLDSAYRNVAITNAIFEEAGASRFPAQLQSYCMKKDDSSFVDFSQRAVQDLKARVEKISQARGGFLVFAEYQTDWENCLAVYLIRDTSGMLFRKQRESGSYLINPVEHLDLDRLAMACKVNLRKYQPREGKYLSYIKRNMEVISKYFIDWIAATGMETSSLYTTKLQALVEGLKDDQLPLEDGKPIPHAALKKRIHDSIKARPGRLVNLNSLSEQFYGEKNRTFLSEVAAGRGILIDTEFQADAKELKKLVRIEVEADGILLRFSPRDKGSKVRLDKDRVIIDSKEFANRFRQELGDSNGNA